MNAVAEKKNKVSGKLTAVNGMPKYVNPPPAPLKKSKQLSPENFTAQDAKAISVASCREEIEWALTEIKKQATAGHTSQRFKKLGDGTVAFLEESKFYVLHEEENWIHVVQWG